MDLRTIADVGVSNHAVEKLRERLPAGSAVNSLSDKEVRAVLRRGWEFARSENKIELWYERVEGALVPTYVLSLGSVLEASLVGVVRMDTHGPRPCFITVITAEMAQRNMESARWARTPNAVGVAALMNNSLAKQLEGVTAQPKVTPAKPIEKMVVTWVSEGKLRFQAVPKDTMAVGNLIHQLLQDGVDEKTIEFWVRSSAKIRRQVTVDFDE